MLSHRYYGLRVFALMAVLLVCVFASACASLVPNQGYDPQMTAAQIKAIAADRSAGVVCSTVPTPMGAAKIVVVNLDQRTIDNGGVSADSDCRVTITTSKPAPIAREPKEPTKGGAP